MLIGQPITGFNISRWWLISQSKPKQDSNTWQGKNNTVFFLLFISSPLTSTYAFTVLKTKTLFLNLKPYVIYGSSFLLEVFVIFFFFLKVLTQPVRRTFSINNKPVFSLSLSLYYVIDTIFNSGEKNWQLLSCFFFLSTLSLF